MESRLHQIFKEEERSTEKLKRQTRDSEVTQTRVPVEAPPSSKAGERKGRGGSSGVRMEPICWRGKESPRILPSGLLPKAPAAAQLDGWVRAPRGGQGRDTPASRQCM